MATVRDLVTAALQDIGVLAGSQTPSAEDADIAIGRLNQLIDSWSLDRLQIFTVTRSLLTLLANQSEYLLGAGLNDTYTDGFDTGWTGSPDSWNAGFSGDGTITNDTSTYQAGGHAVRMEVTATGTASLDQDFLMAAGSEATLSLYGRATFTSAGFVTVQNLDTGNYLTSAGAWQVAPADVFEIDAGGTFVLETLTFDMESAAEIGASSTTLRIILRQDDVTAQVWFDTFSLTSTTTLQIARPTFINYVNLVDTSQTPDLETPLIPLTEDGWASVTQKDTESTQPTHWYYNPTYPFGTLTFWPVPTGDTLQAAIYAPQQVTAFSGLDDTVSLPPGYERMIVKNLAVEICPAFERQPSPLLMQQAMQSMGAVKKVNRRIADLSFDGGSLVGHPGRYNIRTDQ